MTTNIERQFFETFGIEPREFKSCDVDSFCPYGGQICSDTCPYYKTYKVDYPQITDRILLELITFLADAFVGNYCVPDVDYINLEWHILNDCIKHSDKAYIKQQVQSLFKEGNNEIDK